MRLPQVSERIKEAPAQALRGVFAGIGQLLLITDKLRNKTPAAQQVPRARTPEPSETAPAAPAAVAPAAVAPAAAAPAAAASPATAPLASPAVAAPPAPAAAPARPVAEAPADAEKAVPARDFDKTGNVRLLKGHVPAASAVPAPAAETETAQTETAAAATEAIGDDLETVVPEPAVTADGEVVAPLPNYDGLSVASLRARLRNLDVAQLRQLVEYEQAHANRADIITMFTRRIAKLQAETTPEERGEAEAEAEIESREDVEADVQEDVGAEEEGEE
jgi:hypothetical protein